jgi:Ca-activated chloride channel homolog
MTQIDEITLMAYADGELDQEQAKAVEKALENNSELRSRVDAFRESGTLLESAYKSVLDEQAPPSLQQVMEPVGPSAKFKPKPWMAVAASVAIVISGTILSRDILLDEEQIADVESQTVGPIAQLESRPPSQVQRMEREVRILEKAPSRAQPQLEAPSQARRIERAIRELEKFPSRAQSQLEAPSEAQRRDLQLSMVLNTERELQQKLVRESLQKIEGSLSRTHNREKESSVTSSISDTLRGRQLEALNTERNLRRIYKRERESWTASPPSYSSTERVNGHERYQQFDQNPIKLASEDPVSTFSIDVDTGSYSNIRRFLNNGQMPPIDAVRIEEMINYFDYDYPVPEQTAQPFTVNVDMTQAFWNPDMRLLRIGLKGYEIAADQRPPANLVFLIDVSGSMREQQKLPLLQASLKLMASKLTDRDHISIVVYSGQTRVVLEPVSGDNTATIYRAIDQLSAGGSTAGGAGLELAYQLAAKGYIKDGVNRILMATDGDFNVGVSGIGELKEIVSKKRKEGISLTTLGFGGGNYNGALMEQIADVGDGNYAYIDSLKEGLKVLVRQLGGTLTTIAKDVKIQVEFNPANVTEYRLIGYENRVLKREDFTNDKVDAGELGAGHTVTALYEIVLGGSKGTRIDPLRYQTADISKKGKSDEIAFVRLRYKLPGEENSRLIETPVVSSMVVNPAESASEDQRFAAAVAAFGQLLRGGTYTAGFDYDDVISLARSALANDTHGYRREFVSLVEIAKGLDFKPVDPARKSVQGKE